MSNTAEKLDLAAVARRLTASQVGLRERRRFRRMPIEVNGRMLDPLGREHDCRTADISPGDVRIAAPILPGVGDRVVLYLDGIGRVSGNVARTCGEGEVAIIFDFSAHKRERLAEQLTLAANKSLGVDEPARPVRDGAQTVRLEFETGDAYDGEVLDFSLAGMTVRTQRPPPLIGVWVRVGAVYGRVARLIEGGFAIDFAPQKPAAPPP
ncbi:MAG: PilZ domain-containing protein [Hyphomonadaceae bacterium]|nr:PilZ domain-containing protein [Hyphomonadaceae bacterium]GIK48693.1 MAG: pilus assembly protein PilZ [Alphaproteobacteria bacterium]